MVVHVLIDVKICCRRSVKAGQKFIHDNKQFHLSRFVDEFFLHLLFEFFAPFYRLCRRLVEPISEHFLVNLEFAQLLRHSFAALLALNVGVRRIVRGDNRALPFEIGFIEQFVKFARLVDAAGDKKSVSVAAR